MNTFTGLCCAVAVIALLSVHILSGGQKKAWASFPMWVRTPIFYLAAVLLFRAVEILSAPWGGGPRVSGLTGTLVAFGMAWAFTAGALFYFKQSLPAEFWRRVSRIRGFFELKPESRDAVARMVDEGAYVQPPNAHDGCPLSPGEVRRLP